MTIYRSQCRLKYFSGAPEDIATNTLYFVCPDGTSDAAASSAIIGRLTVFYQAIDVYLSPVVQTGMEVRIYKMSDPEPRVPISTTNITLAGFTATNGYPEECAVVLSFQGAVVSGQLQRRRRGRIYLGPLNSTAFATGTTAIFSQVATAFRTAIGTAATDLANSVAQTAVWSVYSQTNNAAVQVTNGWIDVQPDTQRRRGHKVQGRHLWTGT